jgi:glycosyltransferase 2 family protein
VKRLLQAVVGLVVSALALWLTLRGKDLGAIWAAMTQADYRYLWPYLASLLVIHLIRTWRWGILLEPVARIPFARLNAASAIGIMALVVLPFRLGEFARPYLIAQRPALRVSSALSSVVVERVADGIFTGLLLVVMLLGVPEGTPGLHAIQAAGLLMSLAFVGLLGFLVLAYQNRALAVRLTGRLLGPVSPRLAARVSGMMDAFIHGLRLVPSRGKVVLFFALTAAYWGLNGWGMQLLGHAFQLDLSLLAAFTVMGVLVVGVMIPAGPGMVGTFQGAIVLGLALFLPREVVNARGVGYANVLWAAQIGVQVALGLIFMMGPHARLAGLFASASTGAALEAEEREYAASEGRPPA